jgi:hypothetical protein
VIKILKKHTLALKLAEKHEEIKNENRMLHFFHVLILHLISEFVQIQFPLNEVFLLEQQFPIKINSIKNNFQNHRTSFIRSLSSATSKYDICISEKAV